MASSSLLASEHENVLAVQDEPLYEIVNGQRVDIPPMSAYATWLAARLHIWYGQRRSRYGGKAWKSLNCLAMSWS